MSAGNFALCRDWRENNNRIDFETAAATKKAHSAVQILEIIGEASKVLPKSLKDIPPLKKSMTRILDDLRKDSQP